MYLYNSDSCSQLIRVHEMLNGDLLLKYWNGMVSSYLTTSLFSAFFSYVLCGFNYMALYYTGVAVFTVEVALVLLLCCEKDDTLHRRAMKCCIAFSIVGIPAFFYGGEFIRTVTHNEAYVCLLLLYLVLSRASDKKKSTYKLFLGILLWVLLGDDIVLFLFVIPVVIVGVIDWFYNLDSKKITLELCSVSMIALFISKIINTILRVFGVFGRIYEEKSTFLEFDNIIQNILTTVRVYLHYFNADIFGKQINDYNTIGSLIGLCIFFISIYNFAYCIIHYRALKLYEKIMVVSIIIQTAAFTFSNMSSIASGRYLLFCVIELTILIGRHYQEILKGWSLKYFHNLKTLNTLILIFCVAFICSKHVELPVHPEIQEYDLIANVLKEKGLVSGYAEYWQSNVITVATEGKIKVSQIQLIGGVKLVRGRLSTSDRWYSDYANFVIAKDKDFFALEKSKLVDILGEPIEEVSVGDFSILIYDHDISPQIKRIDE